MFDFFKVDDCLDLGGRINENTNECESSNYPPLVERASFVFWMFIVLIASIPSLITYWFIGKLKSHE